MEITSRNIDEHEYAVVGGSNAERFEFESSAHAVNILSDTLYSNKALAVVREIVANAFDAQVVAGVDSPIEIKLTDDVLEIKDKGRGIPHTKMKKTFCTYFGSDKGLDPRQIGGLGLGCKSPFAMTTHFTVINCHGGVKKVYALTKGDESTDGMPSIQEMVSLPTEETGLTIQVPVNSRDEYKAYKNEIYWVVGSGGIKATLNGQALETIDYTGIEKEGFGVFHINKFDHKYSTNNKIAVLMGNIIYPLTDHPAINQLTRDLRELLSLGYGNPHSLVLYAPPSSVVPLPSREGLSYNPKTVKTINEIGNLCLNKIRAEMTKSLPIVIRRHLLSGYDRSRVVVAWSDNIKFGKDIYNHLEIVGAGKIGECLAIQDYNGSRFYHKSPIPKIFTKVVKNTFPTHRWKGFEMSLTETRSNHRDQFRYVSKKLIRILRPALTKVTEKKGKQIINSVNIPMYYRNGSMSSIIKITKTNTSSPDYMKVTKTLTLVNSRDDIASCGQPNGIYAVVRAASQDILLQIEGNAQKHGFTVHGTRKNHPLNSKEFIGPKVPRKKVEVKAPLVPTFVAFNSCSRTVARRFVYRVLGDATVTTPVMYFPLAVKKHQELGFVFEMGSYSFKKLSECKIQGLVVPRNDKELEQLKKMGIPSVFEYFTTKVEALSKNKIAPMYFAALGHESIVKGLAKTMCKVSRKGLCSAFGVKYEDSVEEDKLYEFFKEFSLISAFFDVSVMSQDSDNYNKWKAKFEEAQKVLFGKTHTYRKPTAFKRLDFFSKFVDEDAMSTLNAVEFDKFIALVETVNEEKVNV